MTPTPFGESKGTVPAFPESRAQGAPKTDPMAIAAFVTSLLGAMCIPVLSSVVAIVLAVISLRNIQASKGTLGGRKLAIAGLVFGVLGILLFLAQIAMVFVLPLMDHGPSSVAPPVAATPVAAGPEAPTAAGPLPEGAETFGVPARPSWIELDYPEGAATPDAAFAEIARKAREQGRIPIVYVTAKGSVACDEVTRALASPETSHVSGKIALVRLDARDDAAKVATLGLRIRTVPTFVRLGAEGKRTSDADASQWAENTPENVAIALGPLLDP